MESQWTKIVKTKLTFIALGTFILIGAIFRFYNLNWDQNFFFQPDESNNIARPAAELKFPPHPNKFVYGSLPIYTYRALGEAVSFITRDQKWTSPERLNIIGRVFSATLSVLLIPLVYLLGKEIFDKGVGLLTAFLVSLNVGLIQAAHFGTTETIVTLASLLVVYFGIKIISKYSRLGYLGTAIIIGMAAAAKVTNFLLLAYFFLVHFLRIIKDWKPSIKELFLNTRILFFALVITAFIFFLFFPYSVLDWSSFWDAFSFERKVATGNLPVFFTRQFEDTIPYFFQTQKIFPWILGTHLTLLIYPSWIYLMVETLKKKNLKLFLLLLWPTLYFGIHGFLFAKWVRYMVPLLPFLVLFISAFLIAIWRQWQNRVAKMSVVLILSGIAIISALYSLAFFHIYSEPQTRISSSKWIYANIPTQSTLLLEPLDQVALPLPLKNTSISYKQVWFDFYGLDIIGDQEGTNGNIANLAKTLSESDYIIIGSRRIYANHLRLPEKYPATSKYYSLLFNNHLGYTKIAEFSSYPKLFNLELNDDQAEETFQVFDHPKVMIYQNQDYLNQSNLEEILQI